MSLSKHLADDRCPQCAEHIEERLMGKDNSSGGVYIKCPLCGWKSRTWATEAMAYADWAQMQRAALEEKP